MQNQKLVRGLIIVGVVIVAILIFSSTIFITLQPGEKGVLYKRFAGGVFKDKVYNQGFHILAPWNRMIVYNIRQQQVAETMDVLSSNGLNINIDVTLWFIPQPLKIGYLENEFGMRYIEEVVTPGVRSATRKVIGRYTPEEIYSTKRDAIAEEIGVETAKLLAHRYIEVKDILIRGVKLPTKIKEAIEKKLKMEQESFEYEYKIVVAEQEAKRKKIEAEGIKEAQLIITRSLTDKLLTWQGIEATKELASSHNAKVVVIGSAKNGLPLILGGN